MTIIRLIPKLLISLFHILPYCDTHAHTRTHKQERYDPLSVIEVPCFDEPPNPERGMYKLVGTVSNSLDSLHSLIKSLVRVQYDSIM